MLYEYKLEHSMETAFLNLRRVFGDASIVYPTVIRWFYKFRQGDEDLGCNRSGPIPLVDDFDLQQTVQENPKLTIEELANLFGVKAPTITRHLIEMRKRKHNRQDSKTKLRKKREDEDISLDDIDVRSLLVDHGAASALDLLGISEANGSGSEEPEISEPASSSEDIEVVEVRKAPARSSTATNHTRPRTTNSPSQVSKNVAAASPLYHREVATTSGLRTVEPSEEPLFRTKVDTDSPSIVAPAPVVVKTVPNLIQRSLAVVKRKKEKEIELRNSKKANTGKQEKGLSNVAASEHDNNEVIDDDVPLFDNNLVEPKQEERITYLF
ncbi:hypothetical protein RB195_011518 [Necator americanus]